MESTCKQFRKRNAILACLRQSHTHPSAESLYACLKKENPDISLATVYRNLALFKSQGLISSLGTVNGVERFDGDTSQHAHFVCRKCGDVSDLTGLEIPGELAASVEATGARVDGCNLCFTGICRRCREEKGGEAK